MKPLTTYACVTYEDDRGVYAEMEAYERGSWYAKDEADARIAELKAELAERTAAVIVHAGQALACSEAVANAYAAAEAERDAMIPSNADVEVMERLLCVNKADIIWEIWSRWKAAWGKT